MEVSPKAAASDSDVASPGPRNPSAAGGASATAGQAHAYARSAGKERDAVASASAAAPGGSRRSSGSGANSTSVPFPPPAPNATFCPSSSGRKKTQLDGMVGAVVLALRFLPLDAAPIALIVTDGVADYPSPMEYDGLSMRLCRYDIVISCLLVDRVGATAAGWATAPASGTSGKRVGLDVSTRSIGRTPQDESSTAARKHRVPDLNGLAHLVGVTGGFFYDLETLDKETAAGLADGGGSGGGAVPPDAAPGGWTSADLVWRGGGPGDGPSLALCQVCGVWGGVGAFRWRPAEGGKTALW